MRHALKDPDTHISSIPTASSGKQRILNALYFLGIAVYLVLVSFQGFDLLDEGFHVTFYQQFFRDPESVQYSFFYWFSGLVGGLIVNWFPQYGLIGLRIAGAACIFLTILVANRMLKPYVNGAVLKIAFLLLALLINTEPKDIYYNIVSALIFFTAAWAMFSGLN
ncbi:hypothetical protein, partial [Umezakia ovalisporum]|uniref:hypothetical protein n=1 Tax=Umezakia ovalisporum TaxID=75695 RepID=UPI0039C6A8CB